jgi:hypothetical protein
MINLIFFIFAQTYLGWKSGVMGNDKAKVITPIENGFILGGTYATYNETNIFLLKMNNYFETEWVKAFEIPGVDEIHSLIKTRDRGYLIIGTGDIFNYSDILIIKTNSHGDIEWITKIEKTDTNYLGRDVLEINDGYIILGSKEFAISSSPLLYEGEIIIIKLNLQGEVEWIKMIEKPGWDVPYSLIKTDNGYLVTARCEFEATNVATIIKFNLSHQIEWCKKIIGVIDPYDIYNTKDGGYLFTGTTTYSISFDPCIIKMDYQFNPQWCKVFPGDQGFFSIIETKEGNFIGVGYTALTPGWDDILLVKLSRFGQFLEAKWIGQQDFTSFGYSIIQTKDEGFLITGETNAWGNPQDYDALLIKLDGYGNSCLGGIFEPQIVGWNVNISEISLPLYDVYIPYTHPFINVSTLSLNPVIICKTGILSYDSEALAFNNQTHLKRKENLEELHLVYMDNIEGTRKILYTYSPDGGNKWKLPEVIHNGGFPSISLDSQGNPCVTWAREDTLFYARKNPLSLEWEISHYIFPYIIGNFIPSRPSITITPGNPDTVHIVLRTYIVANGPENKILEISFPITNPLNYIVRVIDFSFGPQMSILDFPSVTYSKQINSIPITLHAVWQRGDTIYYATREIGETWENWGPQFGFQSAQSAHPFVETYGDMIYVVWEHKETPTAPEDIWKARRKIDQVSFSWTNLSQTPYAVSCYPVNASGLFTVFEDIPWPPINGLEIYYKVNPQDAPFNISQTVTNSFYPHSVARFTSITSYLYTVWVDGDTPPYEIKFKKIQYIPTVVSYLTSINGYEEPSSYLVARDSFISTWQIPVDIGYGKITYQFPLEPIYRYKIKIVAYQEMSGKWREWIKIDNKWKHQIKYSAYTPETLEFWVPRALYEDGVIKLTFEKITGNFATAGPIYVYQYEYEEGTEGTFSELIMQEDEELNDNTGSIFPNPFKEKVHIKFQIRKDEELSLKIYDILGRLIEQFNNLCIEQFIWDGKEDFSHPVPQGIYFLKFENLKTRKFKIYKVARIKQ